MYDSQIRAELKSKYLTKYIKHNNTTVIDEFGILNNQAIVDLMVIGSYIHGYEIKGSYDTLSRLERQKECYNISLERVTLVVSFNHTYEALKIIPSWWGVKLVESYKGKVKFHHLRNPKTNPNLNQRMFANLLRKNEALALLESKHCDSGVRSKDLNTIRNRLAQSFGLNELKLSVRQLLLARQSAQVDA